MKHLLYGLLFLLPYPAAALVIYKNGSSLVTGTWEGNGTLTETSANQPYEGNQHYQFVYNISSYWAGYGLNMDNWGNGSPVNFTGYSHVRLAYRGLGNNQTFGIRLRSGAVLGPNVQVGPVQNNYVVVDLPLSGFVGASGLNLAQITEIACSVDDPDGSGAGTVYLDAIELVNIAPPPPSVAWPLANSLQNGINLSNWLEAYWMMPFNAYPETNRYVRADLQFFANAGIKSVRLPVIFERISQTTPPYTVNFSHPAMKLVDSAITWANTFNFKLIIDNHHGYELTNSNYQTERPRLCAIWRQLAQHYAYLDPNRFLFELSNEPTNSISNSNLRSVLSAVIDTVRLYAPNHALIVGGNGWNGADGLISSEPYYDDNIIYTFHNYDPFSFTHQGFSWSGLPAGVTFPQGNQVQEIQDVFQSVKDWSDTYDVPVFLGEFGASTHADANSRCNWMAAISQAITQQNFPYMYWDPKYWPDGFGFFKSSTLHPDSAVTCISIPMGLNFTPLQVELTAQRTECYAGKSRVYWDAFQSDNTENAWFTLEGSTNALRWEALATLKAKPGLHSYMAEDSSPAGLMRYYRIRLRKEDGSQSFTPLMPTACSIVSDQIGVSPNPAIFYTDISLEIPFSQHIQVNLMGMTGSLLRSDTYFMSQGKTMLRMDVNGLPSGMYLLEVRGESGVRWIRSFVIR
ncbi:MAG: cellulase family glycosylhydrolase [Chitinophagales bacterium]|nr:cellulase family glycosylhydrolase [Chitinophagales bacterium]